MLFRRGASRLLRTHVYSTSSTYRLLISSVASGTSIHSSPPKLTHCPWFFLLAISEDIMGSRPFSTIHPICLEVCLIFFSHGELTTPELDWIGVTSLLQPLLLTDAHIQWTLLAARLLQASECNSLDATLQWRTSALFSSAVPKSSCSESVIQSAFDLL